MSKWQHVTLGNILVFPKLKLPGPVPQEAAVDPGGDGPLDVGGDWLRGLLG